ncbi:hypothetical protein ACFLXB_05275 [Chloroflexota bacterium]
MPRRPKTYDDDDGRTIVNMDIEGMRWHDKTVKREKSNRQKPILGTQLTKSESRLYSWYSLIAGFVVASVFSATWILFVLFCTQIWFR